MRPGLRPLLTVRTACLLLTGFAAPGIAAPGDFDTTFGGGKGWVHEAAGRSGAKAMVVQADGKIVVAGQERTLADAVWRAALWRFHANGSRDLTFNNGAGIAFVATGGTSNALALAQRRDGRMVLAGWHETSDATRSMVNQVLVAGFLPDGQPDPDFVPPPHAGDGREIAEGQAWAMTLLPDGKILTGGVWGRFTRHLPDGAVDAAFGSNGVVAFSDPAMGVALGVQSTGKIIAARESDGFVITRLHAGGAPDVSFGPSGTRKVFPQRPDVVFYCRCLMVMDNDKILAGGDVRDYRVTPNLFGFVIVRLLPDGTLDPAFGETEPGYTIKLPHGQTVGAEGRALAVQDDGRILLAGAVGVSMTNSDLALACFTSTGRAEPAFGTGGFARFDPGGGSVEGITAAALLPDGRLLAAGSHAPAGVQFPVTGILLSRHSAWSAAHLAVESPPGAIVPPESVAAGNFGPVTSGARIIEFTLRNTGLVTLTNLQAAITDESVPGDYQVTPPGAATLAPGATTSVNVILRPSAPPGVRTARLRLTSGNTDPAFAPRQIFLTGSRATALEVWRVTWFGSPDNSGPGADGNDYDGDGLPNFMEFAVRTNPHVHTHDPCQPAGAWDLIYNRPTGAVTEFSYLPEAAPAPEGPWAGAGVTSVVLTDDGVVQTVRVTAPAAARLFLRLRVVKLGSNQ